MSTLRELINEATEAIETYKHPDVSEVQGKLHDILQAAELGGINRDHLTDLDIYGDHLHIRTEWSARGCAQSSDYRIPMSIIDAEDPIKAATIYGINKRLTEAKNELSYARNSVGRGEKRVAELNAKLEAAML
jgi:hypothetical protein